MSINDERELNIITPENVRLEFKTAGLGSRSAAHIIDSLILGAGNLFLFLIVLGAMAIGDYSQAVSEMVVAVVVILLFLVGFGYFLLMEFYREGQTVGKKVLGIKVVQDNGQPVTFLSAAIRTFFRIIDFLPFSYFLGIMVCFFHPQNKRIGDMVAGTVLVVDTTRERLATRRQVDKEIEKMRPILPQVTLREDIRRSVTREEWRMLATFMERLPTLSADKRLEYGDQIADFFEKRFELKREGGFIRNPAALLAAIYLILREDWGV